MKTGPHKKFKDLIFSFFARNILILGQEEILLYRYSHRTGSFQREKGKHPTSAESCPKHAVLVVGRELYFELNHSFPITSPKDVSKAVELQAPGLAPRNFSRYSYFPHKQEKETLINLWFFYPELQEWIDILKPLFIFPESALLGLSCLQNGPSICYGRRWNYFLLCFTKKSDDLLSRLIPEGRGEKEAISEFKRLGGYEAIRAKEDFLGSFLESYAEETDYFGALCRQVKDFPLRWWPKFFCWERIRPKRFSRPFIYFQVTVLLLFFLLPFAFSLMRTYSVNKELHAEERETTKQGGYCLKIEEQLEKKLALVRKLQDPLLEYVPRNMILSELSQLLHPPGDRLSSLRLTGRRLEIRGETNTSSALLHQLNKSGIFTEVRLTSPMFKDRKTNKERFVIEVILADPRDRQGIDKRGERLAADG